MASPDSTPSIGLDTSVVMRLLTGEPPAQAERALALLKETEAVGGRVVVSDLVVSEAYFALHAHYGVPKREAVLALLEMLLSGLVSPEPDGCAVEALRAAARGPQRPGLVDRLIHAQYMSRELRLVSFEKASRKLSQALVLRS